MVTIDIFINGWIILIWVISFLSIFIVFLHRGKKEAIALGLLISLPITYLIQEFIDPNLAYFNIIYQTSTLMMLSLITIVVLAVTIDILNNKELAYDKKIENLRHDMSRNRDKFNVLETKLAKIVMYQKIFISLILIIIIFTLIYFIVAPLWIKLYMLYSLILIFYDWINNSLESLSKTK